MSPFLTLWRLSPSDGLSGNNPLGRLTGSIRRDESVSHLWSPIVCPQIRSRPQRIRPGVFVLEIGICPRACGPLPEAYRSACPKTGLLPDSRPPCKSFVKGEKDSPDARLGRARTIEAIRTRSSHVCLSAVVPAFAEPDIHSLSQVHADRHRRLSVCSLPVLKQFEESLGSLISVAQSATAGPGSLRAV